MTVLSCALHTAAGYVSATFTSSTHGRRRNRAYISVGANALSVRTTREMRDNKSRVCSCLKQAFKKMEKVILDS